MSYKIHYAIGFYLAHRRKKSYTVFHNGCSKIDFKDIKKLVMTRALVFWTFSLKSASCQVYWPGDKIFSSCHVTERWSSDHRIMWLYRWQAIGVSYQLAYFCAHRSSASVYNMYLICHVISQDQLVQWSCDFIGGSPQSKSPSCHVRCPLVYCNKRCNIFEMLRDLTRTCHWRNLLFHGSWHLYVTTLPSLLTITIIVEEIWF